jgi:hypothetical protein
MSVAAVLTMGDREWRFTADEVRLLRECSLIVGQQLDERESLDPDNTDDLEIPLEGGPSQQFKVEHVDKAVDYLRHHNFKPPTYGKVISGDLSKNASDPYDVYLVGSYQIVGIRPLHACAEFLQIESLSKLCLIRVGTEVYIDTNESGAVQKIMSKLKITQVYTVQTEVELKGKYPFLANH